MEGIRGTTWQIYRVLITLLVAACVVQIFLAGRGVFGIRPGAGDLGDQSSLDAHRTFAAVIELGAVLVFVCALILWNKRLIGLTLVLVLLAAVFQYATADDNHPWVGGFHPVGGVAIFVISAYLAHSVWAGADKAPPAAAGRVT
jgi:hypothetical protein